MQTHPLILLRDILLFWDIDQHPKPIAFCSSLFNSPRLIEIHPWALKVCSHLPSRRLLFECCERVASKVQVFDGERLRCRIGIWRQCKVWKRERRSRRQQWNCEKIHGYPYSRSWKEKQASPNQSIFIRNCHINPLKFAKHNTIKPK